MKTGVFTLNQLSKANIVNIRGVARLLFNNLFPKNDARCAQFKDYFCRIHDENESKSFAIINDFVISDDVEREAVRLCKQIDYSYNDLVRLHSQWTKELYSEFGRENIFALKTNQADPIEIQESQHYQRMRSSRYDEANVAIRSIENLLAMGVEPVKGIDLFDLNHRKCDILDFAFENSNFDWIYYNECKFIRCSFRECKFYKIEFVQGTFIECSFDSCDFDDVTFSQLEFISCTFSGGNWHLVRFSINEFKNNNKFNSISPITSLDFSNCQFTEIIKFEHCVIHRLNLQNTHGINNNKYNRMPEFRHCEIDNCGFLGLITDEFDLEKNKINFLCVNEVWMGNLKCSGELPEMQISNLVIESITCPAPVFNSKYLISNLTINELSNSKALTFQSPQGVNSLSLNNIEVSDLIFDNHQSIFNIQIKLSKINSIKFNKISSIGKSSVDKYTFGIIKKIEGGYKAVNGIVCDPMSDGYSNASIALVSESRADMGLVSDPSIVVDNLKHARHVFGVYLLLSGLGLLQLLKELGLPGFDELKTFPVFGAEVCLPLESFLFITPLLIIIILIIKPIVDKAFEWAQYINDREKVTQITGFAWTLTQFEKPRSGKKTNKLKWIKITWSSLISYIVRGLMIFAGPAIYAILLNFLFRKELANWLYITHSVTAGILLFLSILFFISSQKFQKPLVFNPYDEPKPKDNTTTV